jgi:STE24 endopeptidase
VRYDLNAALSDPVAATNAYLASVPAHVRAQGAAFFEGGYWIMLWSTLITVVVMLALLQIGWSRRMRDRVARLTRRRYVHSLAYYAVFAATLTAIMLPWSVYVGFIRQRKYGLMNQPFAGWLGDHLIEFAVGLVAGGIATMGFYAIVRKMPRTWPVWGALAGVVFTAFMTAVYPLYIAPLTNTFAPLADERVRDPILSMARAHGMNVNNVYVVDESRRSNRINAQAAGLFGTQRISLNDNLLNRTSLPEIKTAMAHEIGHFVLNHLYESLLRSIILIAAAFLFLQVSFNWLVAKWGDTWGISDIGDLAGLPLLFGLFTVLSLLATPLTNTLNRADENEADAFALNAAREPDGAARLALTSVEFKKLDPTPLEAALFYRHPSPRQRIYKAMVWKSELHE